MFLLSPALCDILHTSVARYSLICAESAVKRQANKQIVMGALAYQSLAGKWTLKLCGHMDLSAPLIRL